MNTTVSKRDIVSGLLVSLFSGIAVWLGTVVLNTILFGSATVFILPVHEAPDDYRYLVVVENSALGLIDIEIRIDDVKTRVISYKNVKNVTATNNENFAYALIEIEGIMSNRSGIVQIQSTADIRSSSIHLIEGPIGTVIEDKETITNKYFNSSNLIQVCIYMILIFILDLRMARRVNDAKEKLKAVDVSLENLKRDYEVNDLKSKTTISDQRVKIEKVKLIILKRMLRQDSYINYLEGLLRQMLGGVFSDRILAKRAFRTVVQKLKPKDDIAFEKISESELLDYLDDIEKDSFKRTLAEEEGLKTLRNIDNKSLKP